MLFSNDDILFPVASFLDSKAILNLALTCKGCGIAEETFRWSLAEELARRLILELSSESELKALPRYLCPNPCCDCGESWIGLLRELELLRSPLTFDQLIGDRVEHVDGDLACITSSPPPGSSCNPFEDEWPGYPNTAICSDHVMRSGKHYATFSMKGCRNFCYYWPGIIRPIQGWDKLGLEVFGMGDVSAHEYLQGERTERWGDSDVHWCTFDQWQGSCNWTDWNAESQSTIGDGIQWSGMEAFEFDDGELGLLLDLDSGTLTAYKNGRRLGIMKDGLSGEYCWTTSIMAHFNPGYFGNEQSIRIKRGKLPLAST
ncbi:hypothetical protein ACHAWT_003808 [Skeletonema menzelii]